MVDGKIKKEYGTQYKKGCRIFFENSKTLNLRDSQTVKTV